MTMPQVGLYCTEICKKEQKQFKMDTLACLYGSRADAEQIEQVID